MKKLNLLVSVILLTLISTLSYAQAPSSFNYQAVVRNSDGDLITNQIVNMRFAIRDGSESGTIQYQEEKALSANQFGLVNHAIGTGIILSGSVSSVTWGVGAKFLQVELDSGSGFVDLGAQQMQSVPYALFSANPGPQGAQGPQGPQGPSGPQGNDGEDGSDGNANISGTANQIIKFTNATTGGDSQISDDGVNVGVGTTEPFFKMDVRGANTDDGSVISVGNSDLSHNLSFFGGRENDPNPFIRWKDTDPLRFTTEPTEGEGFSEVMRIQANGFVGIGTDAPTTELDVRGAFSLTKDGGEIISLMAESSQGSGIFYTLNNGGFFANYAGYYTDRPDNGVMLVFNESEEQKAGMVADITGTGRFFASGPSSANASITSNWLTFGGDSITNSNRGSIYVVDESNFIQAGIHVDDNGDGVIYADVKNFRMTHPTDASKEIWYACVEGPEAGAYDRGTATLVDGAVFVPYSAHYELVIDPTTVTVQLTPHSAETYGLAVTEKTEQGFWVRELMNGTGDFSFDWKVEGVRDGYQDYKVIRNRPNRPVQPEGKIALPAANQKPSKTSKP